MLLYLGFITISSQGHGMNRMLCLWWVQHKDTCISEFGLRGDPHFHLGNLIITEPYLITCDEKTDLKKNKNSHVLVSYSFWRGKEELVGGKRGEKSGHNRQQQKQKNSLLKLWHPTICWHYGRREDAEWGRKEVWVWQVNNRAQLSAPHSITALFTMTTLLNWLKENMPEPAG